MNKDIILSLFRTVLIAAGAFMFGHNILTTTVDASVWQEVVGAALAVGSTIWGIVDKTTTIEAIQSALRSLLSVGGGMLVAAGKISGDKLEAIGGMVTPIITFIYSVTSKQKTALIASGDLRAFTNPVTKQSFVKKVAIILIVVCSSMFASAQSMFKPLPKPSQTVSIKNGVSTPVVQNSFRMLADVTASSFSDGSQLAGGIGIGLQRNTFDAQSQAWVTQYSVSGVFFLDTKAAVVPGLLLGIANGIIQIGPGYNTQTKQFVLLTGVGFKFN